jgi:transglutaminase-like putative cysteine protease
MEDFSQYLAPTEIIDSDHADVRAFAENRIGDAKDPVEKAVRLYYAVRDEIRYDPYRPFHLPEHFRASSVLAIGRGFCVSKVSLLCAAGRACAIPSRAGFADVRNHLATRQLLESMGSDIFIFHGFTEFYLEGKWVKSTPAFNAELCQRHGVAPLEFNGREDSVFQPYNDNRQRFMEYLAFRGTYADIPVKEIVSAFRQTYGEERTNGWIESFEKHGAIRPGSFEHEDVTYKT